VAPGNQQSMAARNGRDIEDRDDGRGRKERVDGSGGAVDVLRGVGRDEERRDSAEGAGCRRGHCWGMRFSGSG
jgi:hypothetical protein